MGLEGLEHEDALSYSTLGGELLIRLGRWAQGWAEHIDPWTNVYGLARTLLALGTASTLVFSHSTTLFRPALGLPSAPFCGGPSAISLFCVFPTTYLELVRWLAVAILLLVASGWRPRVTGVLHWWISYGLHVSAMTLDGGDQVTAVLTLLLVPVTLTDRRRWHWQPADRRPTRAIELYRRLIALTTLTVIRVQVAGIYLHAAVGKLGVEEWKDGTALWYWLTDPSFGVPGWLEPAVLPLLRNGVTLTLLTWGTIAVELFLFMALVMPKRAWSIPLAFGLALHLAIASVQGLVSFALAMAAALVLYLRPVESDLKMPFHIARAHFPWRRLHPEPETANPAR